MKRLAVLALAAGCPRPAAPPIVGAKPAVTALSEWQLGALHVTGAPPLDHAIAGALDPYAAIAGSRLLDISEDATELLVLRDGDAMLVRGPLAPPVARTIDLDVSWAAFGNAGEVVFAGDRDGTEDDRLYRRTTGAPVMIGDGHGRVADPLVRGTRLVWAEPGATSTALWIATTGAPHRVFTGDGAWTPLDVSRDGTQLLARHTISIESSTLYRINLDDGHAVALTPVDPRAAAPTGAFGAHGQLFVVSSAGDRWNAWEILPRGARMLAPELGWDVTELAVSPDGETVAFITNEDGESVLWLYDAITHTHRRAANGPTGGVIDELRFATKQPVLAFTWSDPHHPRGAYTYDLRDDRLVTWTQAPLGAVDETTLAVLEHARVTRDGETVSMLVMRPAKATAPAPVIVELHGGPEDQWRPRWAPFEQFLASRGFAIVQPNVRGSLGYGAAFAALDNGVHREEPVRDVGTVLDWIATQPDLDARRVVVMGTSYGGYLALASLVAYPDRLHAGVDIVGVADFVAFLEGTAPYRRDSRRVEYGDERDPAMRAKLAAMSPIAHAAAIHVPLLVAQGRRDPRVPPAVSDRLVAAVRGAGRSVWYLAADDEGHGFAKPQNLGALQVLIVQLLERP